MEYNVFNDVVMESTEYAMEGFNLKDGWKNFIAFCKKIIAKCNEILRKIIEKFKKLVNANKKEAASKPQEVVTSEEMRGVPKSAGDQYAQKMDKYNKMNIEFMDRKIELLNKMMDLDAAKILVEYMQKLNRQEFSRDQDANLINKINNYNDTFDTINEQYEDYEDKRQSEIDSFGDFLDQAGEEIDKLFQSYPAGTKRNIFYTSAELNSKITMSTADIFNKKLKDIKTLTDIFNTTIRILNTIDNETNLDAMAAEFRTARKNIRWTFIRMNEIVETASDIVNNSLKHMPN